MVDITPLIAQGKHMIRGYGVGSITVRDRKFSGSVLVFPDEAIEWGAASFNELQLSDFAQVIKNQSTVDVLLLGCGAKQQFLPRELEIELKSYNIIVEVMNTGAACRTYNALLAEERRVATALIGL